MPDNQATQQPSGQPPANATPTGGQPSQKSMTKAERRELQEKQRAAKAALKAAGPAGGSASSAKSKAPPAAKKTESGAGKALASQPKDTVAHGHGGAEEAAGKRGPRIFTHFGLPRPLGHTVKGDIHPAVVRLGLLFSEFKICGANARCIATLTAFKNVRLGSFISLLILDIPDD